MDMWLLWLIAAVVFGIIEIMTLSLLSLWFAIGALVAVVLALFGLPVKAQLVVFVIVSIGFLISTRPLVNKFVHPVRVKTGTDLLVGKTGLVLIPIDNIQGTGLVKIGGEEWSAISVDETIIPADSHVSIMEIRGVKLLVEKVD